MGVDYGRSTPYPNVGAPVPCLADTIGMHPIPGGITLDWGTVAAVGSDTVTSAAEGITVKSGQKFLRYGQVLTKITSPAAAIATITGSPTGGTFTLTALGQTTTALAYNAAAATVQAALVALTNVGAGGATVTGSAGGPYTITFASGLGAVTVTASGASLTGGTSPAVAIAAQASGADFNQWGPYDLSATDGRATVARGNVCILNETVLENGLLGFTWRQTKHPLVFVGGKVFRARLIATTGTHSLANGPTFAELEAAMPLLQYVTL